MDFDVLNDFDIEIIKEENSFGKIRVKPSRLCDLLNFMKNNAQFEFNRLNTIIAIDLGDSFELIYHLHSTELGHMGQISVLVDRNSPHAPSVVCVFKSAYFDECEIYDLFGIEFTDNPDLKRLLMPKGWVGYPLRKDYKLEDPKLAWNT